MTLPLSTHSILSPTLIPSPTTTTTLPSGPAAAVQFPFPSLAVQVISAAIATVETRQSTTNTPPTVFPHRRSIGFALRLAVIMVRHLLSGPGGPGNVLPEARLPSDTPSSGQTWCLRPSEAQSTLHRCACPRVRGST